MKSWPGNGFWLLLATSSCIMVMMLLAGMPALVKTWYAWHASAWWR